MGIFSGLFNKENSGNSNTTNKTDNIDQKMQLGDGSVGGTASGGGYVNIHTSDMGAINNSFLFAGAVADDGFKFANATTDSSLKFANAASDSSMLFARSASDSSFKFADAASDKSLQFGRDALDGNARAMDSGLKFAKASTDSSMKFANAALDSNQVITHGALGFAAGAQDSSFKLVNATVDGALQAVTDTAAASTKAMMMASQNASLLANATTDSALRFGDSAVAQSYDFARAITQGAANETAASATRADQLVTSALGSVKDAYGSMSASLADAYTNSKAGEQKVLVGVAVAVLGLVAIAMMKR